MLAIQKSPKYIQRTVELPNGEWAVVVFELLEVNGKIIARAVSGKKLSDIKKEGEGVLCLPAVKSPVEFIPILSTFNFIDFVNLLNDFSFVMSQPTRAPAY